MGLFVERTLPAALPEPSRSLAAQPCTLSELTPGAYVDTQVRVVRIRSRGREDELGERRCALGIAEDDTFRVPFLSYKPLVQFDRDTVFRFTNAYVHEFEDGSLLLILSEHSRVSCLLEEDPASYVWTPRIGEIRRPLGFCRVTLQGIISSVKNSSGLIRRCAKCGRVILDGACPEGHNEGSYWDVRIAGRISDETGSMSIIFSKYMASRILQKPLSEILLLADAKEPNPARFETDTFELQAPETMEVNEATATGDPCEYRSSGKPIVLDSSELRVFYPPSTQVDPRNLTNIHVRTLRSSDPDDRKIMLRLTERALDLQIRKRTELPKLHGVYLVEKPVQLYRCELAKLYLGLGVNVCYSSENMLVEAYSEAMVRESVLDFIGWKRDYRGSSAQSIKRLLTTSRSDVLTSPNGSLAKITDVVFEKAANFRVPTLDIALPEFWKSIYDIDVNPDEKPLIVVKPYSLGVSLTYPPSCVFFDERSIWMSASVLRFVGYKRRQLRQRALGVAKAALQTLASGELGLKPTGEPRTRFDTQRLILHDIKRRLLGRTVRASGSVVQTGGRLYFFPKTVEGVS